MIYIFDKKQAIIKVLTNDDFTAAHLNFKINTATTFEFSLPASKALPSGSKYVATPHPLNDSKFIMLRLTERVDNTEIIDYSAYELAYQELATDGYIEDKRPQNQSALNLMKIALDGSNWELNNVNISGAATTNFYYVDRLSAISKVVDLLGGEIVFYIEIQGNAISGRYMDYLARQGADTSKVFASGSNLLTVERQSDTSNIYTAILPRGKGEEIDNGEADTPDGYGRRINIADVEWKKSSGKPLDKPKGSIVLSDPDATAEWGQINGNARLLLQTYDDIDDVNVLINSAYKTLQSVNHPQIQYSATVADVGGLSLGDTVLIMHGDRDLSYKTRVFEVKYDLLSPDQTELSLGDDLSSNSITSQINSLNVVADTTSSQTQWTINQIGRPSTTFGNTEPANPKVGDVFFKELPDGGTEIYRWNGDIWELLASPTTADDIATAVDDAVAQANAHTDEVKQGLSSDIDTAKSQAASQANAAEANAKSEATSQFSQAQNALAEAKTNLQNDIDESKGNIVEINKTLTGFDGTLQRVQDAVNGLGQTNQLMNTEFTPDTEGWTLYADKGSNAPYASFASYGSRGIGFNTVNADANTYARLSQTILLPNTRLSTDVMSLTWRVNTRRMDNYCHIWLMWQDANGVSLGQSTMGNWNDSTLNNYNVLKWENISIPIDAKQVDIRFETREGTNAYLFQPMVSFTNTIGTYVQGNYNNNEALAKVKLTADQALLDLSTYQIDADGRIKKAQSGIEANATAITKKVSQTDYDKKTGELSNKLNTTTDTADGTKQALSDYKEYANGNISGIASDLSKLAGEVSLKLSKTDYDDSQSILNTSLSQWKADYDGWTGTVSRLSDKVNNLGQVNQLFNTEFSPDLSGWDSYPTISTNIDSTQSHNGSNVIVIKHDSSTTWGAFRQSIANFVKGDSISASVFVGNIAGAFQINIESYDSSKNRTVIKSSQLTSTGFIKFENLKIPADATQLYFSFWSGTANSTLTISQPMLVFATSIGTYVQGNYNNNAALAQVKITADGISKFVRDSSGNLSSDFQTALSKTSIVTGSTLASSIQVQTASQISSALTDNNKNIIAMINLDASGVQIAGKNIILDGTVKATSAFWANQINAVQVSASNITVGTLNGNQVNITNVDASKISSGIISGIDMIASDIALNNDNSQIHGSYNWKDLDEVIFPRSYDGTWNLGTRRLAFNGKVTPTNSEDGGAYNSYTYYGLDVIKMRRLFATGNIYKSLDIDAGKGEIYIRKRDTEQQDANNNVSALNADDLQIRGDHSRIWLSTRKIMDTLNTRYTTRLSSGKVDDTDAYVHTYTLRAKRFFQPYGYDDGQNVWMYFNPNSDDSTYGLGLLQGDQIISSTWAYNRTYSYASNMYITSNGFIGRATSASKYKLAITHYDELDRANKLLSIKPARWFDKSETEQYADELNGNDKYEEHLPVKPHFGLIAEDLVEAGLDEFVSYGSDGQVEGLEYDRVWTTLIPLIKNMKERIEELERKVA